MSYRIEYQWTAFVVDGESLGLSEDRFIVAIQGGDNNVYEADSGRRARAWEACLVGTRTQVLRQTVYFAGACEGGGLKPHGRDCTPESYIRRIRRLLDDARDTSIRGYWRPRLRVAPDHPAAIELQQCGVEPREEQRYGTSYALFQVSSEHLATYFQLIDQHCNDLPAWNWIEVGGLLGS